MMTDSTIQTPSSGSGDLGAARRGGLIGWGVVLIVIGAVGAVGAVSSLANTMSRIENALADGRTRGVQIDTVAQLQSSIIMIIGLGVTALCVWTGIASCQARRWARPVAMILATAVGAYWLLQAIGDLLMLPFIVERASDAMFERRRTEVPTGGSLILLTSMRVAVKLGAGVVAPWFLYRFYASPATEALLNRTDPRTRWSDRMPVVALGWTVLAAISGASLLFNLFHPKLVAFVMVLRGREAIIGVTILAMVLLWAALMCWRRERLGWIVSFIVIVALRLSLAWYFATTGTRADLDAGDVSPAGTSFQQMPRELTAPSWHPATMVGLEAALIAALGLLAARHFSGYRIAIARVGSAPHSP